MPHFKTTTNSPVHITDEGKLVYKTDDRGNRVPDFSYCGYMASEKAIPDVPVKIIVRPSEGDATARIQSAINYVSSLPPDASGFRGTVLLGKGIFTIKGSLKINSSGVVLRGSGYKEDGTVLLGAGSGRETLIKIAGKPDLKSETPVNLADEYFPVNTTTLKFTTPHPFKTGDRVIVTRPSTKEWIEAIGADKIGIYVDYQLTKWEEGDFDINWHRTVTSVTPLTATIDVPLTCALDPRYGGGTVSRYYHEGEIKNTGIENLKCISAYDTLNLKDENHRWMAVTIENASDSWVRRMTAENFVSSAVAVWETARRITVEDCKSLSPAGEIGNHRRWAFHTLGQQVLFQRCYAEHAWHAFSTGFTAPGPNAFVQCFDYMPYNFSGATGGWATGILFDKMTIDGGIISFAFRDADGQGGGWSAANSFCWQCRAARIHLPSPPGAQNWAYGSWAQGYGNGHHELEHTFIKPESFYYAQLEARTGKKNIETDKILVYDSDETTAPTTEYTSLLSRRSKTPDLTMDQWIDMMTERYPVGNDISEAKNYEGIKIPEKARPELKLHPVSLKNGWIVKDNMVVSGRRNRTSLWRGSTRTSYLKNPPPNLLRFVPGRTGRGLTDDLDTLTYDMIRQNVVLMQNFPSLWYERRRDDHARTRRADADVWTPFFEQPFSRSGVGEAFDRLSRYDLTKWNTWYWMRLKEFADIADREGLILVQEHYCQHNIIEEGAHWVDYPWRSANNINNTGFAEPPHYAGDKRVYMAEEFYDTSNVVRNKLYRNYIRKNLDNFRDNCNIVHHLGWEYTGPLHFVQFWLDVIDEWQKENNTNVLVMLPGTKEVQDAILSDPVRSELVDIIDIIQWQYREDGSLYAPVGGVSLAERQYARIMDVGTTSLDQIHRAVYELRTQYPGKAVVCSRRGVKFSEWAVFMAGGSLASLPVISDAAFASEASLMEPASCNDKAPGIYVLEKKGTGYIIFSESGETEVDLTGDRKNYRLKWIDPSSGEIISTKTKVRGGLKTMLRASFEGASVAWLTT
ncbi:MAG: pectate lyase [Bacteroidales bacterium]|nr:pectate lyase [Bacteroidales bacterium]